MMSQAATRCFECMSDSQSIVIQLSSLSYGAEFTIPDQQRMKSILHMIGQKVSNHNLGFAIASIDKIP